MLQRYATLKVNAAGNTDPMFLNSMVQSANDIMPLRIEEGEELSHDILRGTVGHGLVFHEYTQCIEWRK
jgi:hypothetical protein